MSDQLLLAKGIPLYKSVSWDYHLYLTFLRVLKDKEAILKVLMEATQHCPHSCELYYLAARLELFFNTEDGGKKDEERDVQKAIEWLTLCVTKFFKLSSDHPLQPGDALYLYR